MNCIYGDYADEYATEEQIRDILQDNCIDDDIADELIYEMQCQRHSSSVDAISVAKQSK